MLIDLRVRSFVPLLCVSLSYVLQAGAAGPGVAPSGIDGISVRTAQGITRIDFCSDRVVHIVAGATSLPVKAVMPVVVERCAGVKFTTASSGSRLRLETKKLSVEIDRQTGAVRFLNLRGQPLLAEQPSAADPAQPSREFLLSPGEALYGLGQHQEGFLNLRDIPVRLLQANTNIAIPFLVSSRGYGLLWNNPALTDFNPADRAIPLDESGTGSFTTGPEGDYGFFLSGNLRAKLTLTVDGKQIIDIRNMWVPASAGGKAHLGANTTYRVSAGTGGKPQLSVRFPSETMGFRSEVGEAVDYYFIYGPEPEGVIAAFRQLTGPAPLLPRWAFGFWQCRERYSSQQQILDAAAEFRRRRIPVDVLVQDWQYWGKYGWNAMRFDEGFYPDPGAMMDALHRENLHLAISVWAKFGADTEVGRQMRNAHLVLHGAASTGEPGETHESEYWADLFNPQAQSMYWENINRRLFQKGIDGWWLDASEPEGDPLKSDETFLGPGRTVRNAYPLFETSAVYEGQRATAPDKRVVILTRSAYAGQQRNGTISWSGDISGNWETLRRQIPAGLGFSASGMPYWTTDVGGFFRPSDQYTSPEYHELLVRWFQFGAFSPIFRVHGYQSETEMWKYGPQVEGILRQYDELRYRLLPYIYSAAWGVTNRGESLMTALPLVFPNDPSLRETGDQFLFGASMLIAPVVEAGARERKVQLPAGENWVDFWTGRNLAGGQTITAEARLEQMPIYVKAGSILPLGPVTQSAAEVEDPIEIRIYSGKDTDFLLYEDRGDGYAYENGEHATIPLHWDDRRRTLTLGARSGSFPEIIPNRTVHAVLVAFGHGTGPGVESNADRTAVYQGRLLTINLDGAQSRTGGSEAH